MPASELLVAAAADREDPPKMYTKSTVKRTGWGVTSETAWARAGCGRGSSGSPDVRDVAELDPRHGPRDGRRRGSRWSSSSPYSLELVTPAPSVRRHRRRRPGPHRALLRVPPVREKTSSSDGGRTSTSSTSAPAASSARTTPVARPAGWSTAASTGGRRRWPGPAPHKGPDGADAFRMGVTPVSPAVRAPARLLELGGVPSAMTLPWSTTTIRSASSSASSRYCVVSRTVTPSPISSRMACHTRWRLVGSSPVVGSSKNKTGGRVISEAARSRRRRIPPE